MTIIDQYIFDHQDTMTNSEMAVRIGIPELDVKIKRIYLKKPIKESTTDKLDEIHALSLLVIERKEGWAVEVAKRRIKDINRILNM